MLTDCSQVYSFVFDRLRSVRQDMIIQRTTGPDSRAILERTVRLLVYASFRLCGEPLRLYDPRINDTHLQESLSWLLQCYAAEPGPHGNQEEFQALSLLYNLGGCGLMLARHLMTSYEKRKALLFALLCLGNQAGVMGEHFQQLPASQAKPPPPHVLLPQAPRGSYSTPWSCPSGSAPPPPSPSPCPSTGPSRRGTPCASSDWPRG